MDEPLISTRERPGTFDALETAKPDEPLFVLQGGDPFAADTVEHWADLARTAGRREVHSDKARLLLTKATSAEQVAWAMRSYRRGEGAAEIEATRREQEAMATDRNSVLAKGAGRLNNALAEVLEVAEMVEQLDPDAFAGIATELRDAVEVLRFASEAIEPRRHMRRVA